MNLQAVKSCSCWNSAGDSFPLCAIPSPRLSSDCSSSSPHCARVTSPGRDQDQHLNGVDQPCPNLLRVPTFCQYSPPSLYFVSNHNHGPLFFYFHYQVATLSSYKFSKQVGKCLLKRGNIFRSYYLGLGLNAMLTEITRV